MSDPMTPTKKQIEKAAAAVVGKVRFEGGCFTEKFLATAKWPKDFYPSEREEVRAIVRAALDAALSEKAG